MSNSRLSPNTRYSRPLIGLLVLAFITAIGLPFITIKIIYPAYSKILISSIMEETGRLAKYVIPPAAKHSKLTHKVLEDTGFSAAIYRMENELGLLKIKIYSDTGLILYSTDFSEIGTRGKESVFFDKTLKGIPCGDLKHEKGIDAHGIIREIDILETCVPIMRGDSFLGAFELVSDVSSHIQKLNRVNTLATYGTILACCSLFVVGSILFLLESSRIRERKKAETLKADVEQITRHDIKSPLIGALNGIEYLRHYTTLDEEQQTMLNDMRTSVSTGLDLINRSLDIYKMEIGMYQYVPQNVDILSILQRVVADLSSMADMQNVAISISQSGKSLVADDSLFIQAEGSLCYSLFANLIKNGVEASLANQQVTIDLIKTDIVTISVHNSGQVPDAIKNTFFDKYATANKTTGTGLGTYSAKLMTEAMGGTISLTTSEETGTTITVTLPCSTPSK